MDPYKPHRATSSTSIGKISLDIKDEVDESKNQEEQQIDELINESSWVAGKIESKMPSAPSFGDLMAEEQTKKKQRRKKQAQPSAAPAPAAIERPAYSNQPLRQQQPYPEHEAVEGEEVWDATTGKTTFIPYVKEEQTDNFYDDGYMMEERPQNVRGGYGRGGNRRGGYGRSGYGDRNYRGVYRSQSYNGNQFYDDGDNNRDYDRGSRPYGHQGSQFYGGGGPRYHQPQPKLSAAEKYGDYTRKADNAPTNPEEKYGPIRREAKSAFSLAIGGKAQPPPPPAQQPAPKPQADVPAFNPIKKQPEPTKPAEKPVEKEEEWNPDEE